MSPYVLYNMQSFWTGKSSVQFTKCKGGEKLGTMDNYLNEKWQTKGQKPLVWREIIHYILWKDTAILLTLCIFSVMRCTAFLIWDWDPVMVTILSGEACAADMVIFAPLSSLKLVTFAPPLKIHQHHAICVWVGRLTLASEQTPFLKILKHTCTSTNRKTYV